MVEARLRHAIQEHVCDYQKRTRSQRTGYDGKWFESFLQGSYGNDTNVYADSDVDVVMKLNSAYFRDLSRLSPADLAAYNAAFSGASVTYGFPELKRDVEAALRKQFGKDVNPGKKAIWVKPNGGRRNTDVLPALQFRRYYEFKSLTNQRYDDGIGFLLQNGSLVENFPKQHSKRCTAKHQSTNQWLKPTVRVVKNMRNRMIQDGGLAEGVAPSYFIEGLFSNVPDGKFGKSYSDIFVACFNWIAEADDTKLTCANQLHWLVRDGQSTSWPTANFATFKSKLRDFWNNW